MQGRLDFTVTTTYVTCSTSQGRPPFDTPHGRWGLYVGAHRPSPFLPLFSSPPRFIDPQPTGFQCQSRGHCPTPTPPTPNVPRMLILTYLQAPDPRPCMQQRRCGAPAQMDMLSEVYCAAVGGHAVPAPLVSISLSWEGDAPQRCSSVQPTFAHCTYLHPKHAASMAIDSAWRGRNGEEDTMEALGSDSACHLSMSRVCMRIVLGCLLHRLQL